MRFLLTLLAAFLGVLAAFFFVFVLLVALVVSQDTTPTVARDSVLLLELRGAIPESEPADPFTELFTRPSPTLREVVDALHRAAEDDRIAAVWVRPTAPALSWAAASELRQALEHVRARGKPVVASAGPEGFSHLSYYLASAADSVFSSPEAPFQFNGLYLAVPFFAGTLDKLGIEPVVVRAGAYKTAAEPFTERRLTPENREQYAEVLAAFDAQLRDAVAASRNVARARLDEVIAQGGVYTAREALGLGLLDGLRYERQTEAALRRLTRQDDDRRLRTVSLRDYVRATRGESRGRARDRIALVYATGTIVPGESGRGGAGTLGARTFVEAIEQALRDERTRAIVVRIDSPGGSASASDEMWEAVRAARERVPVVVSMGPIAASGGYYIAAPAHAIVAEPTTITGSIGVISLLFNAQAFLNDRLGVTVDTLRTGPAAGLFDVSRPPAPMELAALERLTEEIYATFVRRVAEGRGLPEDSVRALGGGRIYPGVQAQRLGLVDELGDLRRAITLAAERAGLEADAFRLRVLPVRPPLAERLLRAFDAEAVLTRWHARRMSDAERHLRRWASLVQEVADAANTPQMRLFEIPEIR